jgi:hypothetical protein
MYNLKRITSIGEWEKFQKLVIDTPFTSFTLLPDWLEGYCVTPLIKKIGFLFYNTNNELMGGISGIRFWFGKWITIYPSDPIIIGEFQNDKIKINEILLLLLKTTKGKVHISTTIENAKALGLKKCKFPRGFYPDPGLGIVTSNKDLDNLLEDFKYSLRRKIKDGLKNELHFSEIGNTRMKEFYRILQKNSLEQNYKIRPYFSLKRIWKKGLENKTVKLIEVKYANKIVGCAFYINAGQCLHYIMGASAKEMKKMNVGYLLHWKGISYTINSHYIGYNISIGGPQNIEKIKDDFGRNKILIKTSYAGIF